MTQLSAMAPAAARATSTTAAVGSEVAIVTSDGYEASGRAADPRSAAADYATLDAFTRFLEKRVVSENLWLLRRLMAEYFCHCNTTLREFIAQGGLQISVGPIDATSEPDLAEAQRLLREPRSFAQSGTSSSVFTYLVTKVRLVRSSLLMRFFVEFCLGEESALCEFVDRAEGFVAILPLAAPHADTQVFSALDPIPFVGIEPLPMPPPPAFDVTTPTASVAKAKRSHIQPKSKKVMIAAVKSPVARRGVGEEEIDSDEEKDLAAAWNDKSQKYFTHPSAAMGEMRQQVSEAVLEIEKAEPWRRVYNEQLPLPFDELEAHDIAKQLRAFWVDYGRAVWERHFWRPVEEPYVQAARKHRQRRASLAFERIIIACHDRFGARFFYKLDRKQHGGWWYRGICVDLAGLAVADGLDKCLSYVKTQQYKRFPECGHALPIKSANAGVISQRQRELVVSKAMWAQSKTKPGLLKVKQRVQKYFQRKKEKKEKKGRKHAARTMAPLPPTTKPRAESKPSREELGHAQKKQARPAL